MVSFVLQYIAGSQANSQHNCKFFNGIAEQKNVVAGVIHDHLFNEYTYICIRFCPCKSVLVYVQGGKLKKLGTFHAAGELKQRSSDQSGEN